MSLTKEQFEILEHTANRTANRMYCGDSEDMQVLVKLGLMEDVGMTGYCPDKFFSLTGAGRKALNSNPLH